MCVGNIFDYPGNISLQIHLILIAAIAKQKEKCIRMETEEVSEMGEFVLIVSEYCR
jgi:hypothetical protein